WQYRPWLVLIFGIDVIPLGIVSAVLVVLQGAVVGSWCFLCLVTAVISLILVYMAFDEVWSCLLYLKQVWQETRDKKLLWKAFCGLRTPEADRIADSFIKPPAE
ncbi:MAG: vitamin K epoxide reductase, partial [Planctomycetota bacterium]